MILRCLLNSYQKLHEEFQELEKVFKRDLTRAANDLGGELAAKNLNIHLYRKHTPLGSKIKGLYEVYQQMNSPVYKRAVTIYKKKR